MTVPPPRSSQLPSDPARAVHSEGPVGTSYTVESDHINGIPAFWGNDRKGSLSVTLTFRVGEADERLRTRGRCHLLQRLVLADLTDVDAQVIPSITTLRTAFTITGSDAGVAAAANRIARAISTLRTDRIDEQAALVVQSWHPLDTWDTTLMGLRFGCRGYGLGAFPLLGLRYPDAAEFSDWARTWFSADNAVVSANRRPTSAFDLGALGDGVRKSLPDPHQIDRSYPALAAGPDGQVAVSFLTRFDMTVELALGLLRKRFERRFAAIDPSITKPQVVSRRTGWGLATVALAITAAPEVLGDVRNAMSAGLFTFSMNGPGSDELDQARIHLRRSQHDPAPGYTSAAAQRAVDELFGENRNTAAALAATPADLAKVVRDFTARGIWLVPSETPVADRRLAPVTDGSKRTIEGEVYPRLAEATTSPGFTQLTAGPLGLSVHQVDGSAATIRFSDVVALERNPDGTRTLWGDDGTRIHFEPSTWTAGGQLAVWIDSRVEPWVILDPRPDVVDQAPGI